jgi:hypothetical protein
LGGVLLQAFLRVGLYPAMGQSYAEELRLVVVSTSFAFLIITGFTFALKTSETY